MCFLSKIAFSTISSQLWQLVQFKKVKFLQLLPPPLSISRKISVDYNRVFLVKYGGEAEMLYQHVLAKLPTLIIMIYRHFTFTFRPVTFPFPAFFFNFNRIMASFREFSKIRSLQKKGERGIFNRVRDYLQTLNKTLIKLKLVSLLEVSHYTTLHYTTLHDKS